jgi:hypothetical protein
MDRLRKSCLYNGGHVNMFSIVFGVRPGLGDRENVPYKCNEVEFYFKL